MERKWLPHFAELIDRLSIHQLKEVFIPENKEKYSKEMDDIVSDINLIIKEDNIDISGDLIRFIVFLSQINLHIWHNESEVRLGKSQDLHLLELTHGLNGLRNSTQNMILDLIGKGSRKDWKVDCLAENFKDWEVSLFNKKKDDKTKK